MTPEQLIAEGRRLQRPCFFLRPQGSGSPAAVWYKPDRGKAQAIGECCWLSVDARFIPGLPPAVGGYISVFADEQTCQDGRVVVTPSLPALAGTPLYAHEAQVLPPIDALIARGSEEIGAWFQSHGWDRSERYNDNFPNAGIVEEYERVWYREFPLFFQSDIYAILGGWHVPMADHDWHDLIDEQLMIFTLRDSEPWLEAWRTRSGEYRVIQRIT